MASPIGATAAIKTWRRPVEKPSQHPLPTDITQPEKKAVCTG
jgi:hypothetical protein